MTANGVEHILCFQLSGSPLGLQSSLVEFSCFHIPKYNTCVIYYLYCNHESAADVKRQQRNLKHDASQDRQHLMQRAYGLLGPRRSECALLHELQDSGGGPATQ